MGEMGTDILVCTRHCDSYRITGELARWEAGLDSLFSRFFDQQQIQINLKRELKEVKGKEL